MTFARTATDGANAGANSTTIATAGYTSVATRLIVGYIGWEGGNTTVGITDTAGNTYVVSTPTPNGGGDQVIASFYCLSSSGHASNVVTATFGAARSVRTMQIAEYSKTGTAVYDGYGYGEVNIGATATTGTITTTGAVGLLFAGTKAYNSTTITANGGLTLISQQGSFGGDAEQFLTSAGSYTASMSNNTSSSLSLVALAFKEGPADPTVTSVTSSGVTEGGNMVFTVSLSGATTRSTNYGFGVTGTAIAGTDYTSPLTSGMCNNSVAVSGSNFVAPTAVSSWTVTIPTTQDALDEDNETIVLTVGGTASTGGTITDDDPAPTVTFSDGVESFGVVTCVATLGAVSGKDVTFDVSTANGSKTAGTHYTAIVAQTVTIPAGSLTAAITVNTL